jgi:hypothetical protein
MKTPASSSINAVSPEGVHDEKIWRNQIISDKVNSS